MKKTATLVVSFHPKIKAMDRPQVRSCDDAYQILKEHFAPFVDYKETFFALFLNRNARCIGVMKIAEGGIHQCPVDMKIIVQGCLLVNACDIIIAHNHPSGNSDPSDNDVKLTKKVSAGLELLDMKLLDHLIIVNDGYYSFTNKTYRSWTSEN